MEKVVIAYDEQYKFVCTYSTKKEQHYRCDNIVLVERKRGNHTYYRATVNNYSSEEEQSAEKALKILIDMLKTIDISVPDSELLFTNGCNINIKSSYYLDIKKEIMEQYTYGTIRLDCDCELDLVCDTLVIISGKIKVCNIKAATVVFEGIMFSIESLKYCTGIETNSLSHYFCKYEYHPNVAYIKCSSTCVHMIHHQFPNIFVIATEDSCLIDYRHKYAKYHYVINKTLDDRFMDLAPRLKMFYRLCIELHDRDSVSKEDVEQKIAELYN